MLEGQGEPFEEFFVMKGLFFNYSDSFLDVVCKDAYKNMSLSLH